MLAVSSSVGPPADRQTHLAVLSGVSGLLLRTDLIERLDGVTSSAAALEALRVALRAERSVAETT